jgi:hypothetical protein
MTVLSTGADAATLLALWALAFALLWPIAATIWRSAR